MHKFVSRFHDGNLLRIILQNNLVNCYFAIWYETGSNNWYESMAEVLKTMDDWPSFEHEQKKAAIWWFIFQLMTVGSIKVNQRPY